MDEESNQIFEVRKNISNKMKWYWSAISLIDGITYLLNFSLLLYEIESGRNSIGEILAIYVYVENAFSAMISISRYKTEIYNSDAALSRAFDVITPFMLDDKVSNLSGGEKKRIAIARTMNKKVPIYLMNRQLNWTRRIEEE